MLRHTSFKRAWNELSVLVLSSGKVMAGCSKGDELKKAGIKRQKLKKRKTFTHWLTASLHSLLLNKIKENKPIITIKYLQHYIGIIICFTWKNTGPEWTLRSVNKLGDEKTY